LYFAPWAPLDYATGANTTVNVTAWFELLNLQLSGPTQIRLSNSSELEERKQRRMKEQLEHQGLLDAVVDPLSGAAKSVVSGAIDGGSSLVKSGVKSLVSSIPLVGPFLAGFFDKPPLKTEPLKICRTSATSWVHGVGNSAVSTLSVTPGLLRLPREEEVGKIGTVIDYIKIPALITDVLVNTANTSNSQVFWVAVTPDYPTSRTDTTFNNGRYAAAAMLSYNTPLSYMSTMYTYWRGTINYALEIVLPATTTCTFAIVWLPDQSQASMTYDEIASQCSSWVFDCNGPTTTHFSVAFMSDTTYKWVALKDFVPSSYGTMGSFYTWKYNGSIGIYLLNTVMSNVAAPTTMDMRLYSSAGDDFEFAVPSGTLLTVKNYGMADTGYYPPPPSKLEHQGLTDEVAVSSEQLVTSKEVTEEPKFILDQVPRMEPYLGESHMESSYFKRYQLLYANYFTPSTFDYRIIVPVCPTMMSYWMGSDTTAGQAAAGYSGRFSTPLCHFGLAHKYWRGSLNYRLIVTTTLVSQRLTTKACFVPILDSGEIEENNSNPHSFPIPGYCGSLVIEPVPAISGAGTLLSTDYNNNRAWTTLNSANYGTEIVCGTDSGVIDINVPYFSDQPVKACCSGFLPASQTPATPAPDAIIVTCHADSQAPIHMTGNVLFTIGGLTSGAPIRVELYIAAGDDLVFTYPVAPPVMVNVIAFNTGGITFPTTP